MRARCRSKGEARLPSDRLRPSRDLDVETGNQNVQLCLHCAHARVQRRDGLLDLGTHLLNLGTDLVDWLTLDSLFLIKIRPEAQLLRSTVTPSTENTGDMGLLLLSLTEYLRPIKSKKASAVSCAEDPMHCKSNCVKLSK